MKVGLVQQRGYSAYEPNLAASIEGVRSAAAQGTQLVLLQELHTGLYFCRREDPAMFELAEPIPGPTTDKLGGVAQELGIVIVGSVFERRAAGIYHNTAVVLDTDGSLTGRYRKMHIPDDPGYYEKYYFTSGDLGFTPVETSLARLGVLICWDQWFPEAARLVALAGAELLIYPSAIGWDPRDPDEERERQFNAWQLVQRGHAIANSLPLMCCNRVGMEGDPSHTGSAIQFWGSSFICGPQGEMLAEAPADQPAVLVADVDLDSTTTLRRKWPFLRDRRIDAYEDLRLRYRDKL